MDYPLRPYSGKEASLFYNADDHTAQSPDSGLTDEELCTAAHMSGYFYTLGPGFHPTLQSHNENRYITEQFHAEYQAYLDSLCAAGGPLHSRTAMRQFCAGNADGKLPDKGRIEYGFVTETDHYLYCLRLTPEALKQAHLYIYDLDARRERTLTAQRVKLLAARLDDNLLSRAAQIGPDTTIGELHTFGCHAAMHRYLTEKYSFNRGEAERLLKFRDPLNVAVECAGLRGTIHDLNVGYYLDMANPEADYPMLPDADAPAQEPAQRPERKRAAHKNKER